MLNACGFDGPTLKNKKIEINKSHQVSEILNSMSNQS